MVALSTAIDAISPSDDSTGVVLTSAIEILFDREIDESSVEFGGLLIQGPDTDTFIYPGYSTTAINQGEEEDLLSSPGYPGLVQGTFQFVRYSPTLNTPVNTLDTTGDGTLYRTRVIFTPAQPLAPATDYILHLIGDEDLDDEISMGIKPRTVFDVLADGGNSGSSNVTVSGSYTGELVTDTYNIRITKAGVCGIAEYEWWRDSAVLDLEGPILTSLNFLPLDRGVNVKFGSGSFSVGDTFTVVVKTQEALTGTVTASFTTGGGSITAAPTSAATSPLGDPVTTSPTNPFYVVGVTPSDGASNLKPDKYRTVVVEFSEDIDEATVTQDAITVLAEPVSDHPSLEASSPNGPVAKTLSVNGKYLTITL